MSGEKVNLGYFLTTLPKFWYQMLIPLLNCQSENVYPLGIPPPPSYLVINNERSLSDDNNYCSFQTKDLLYFHPGSFTVGEN